MLGSVLPLCAGPLLPVCQICSISSLCLSYSHDERTSLEPRVGLLPIFSEYSIDQFVLMFKGRQINLEPGFQRKSVWTGSDRQRLIQSIVAGYPVPSVFLYKRHHGGRLIYDVIDGKQRLESILMFLEVGRFGRDAFDAKLDLGDGLDWCGWREIRRSHAELEATIRSYKIQTVEVSGELNQIIDLFVRINSTGKKLTSGEKRHARFYTSRFLKEAEQLVGRFHRYLRDQRVLTVAQLDRMKGTELFAELLMSLHHGGPINKKTALDRAIGNDSVNGNTLTRLRREFVRTMRLIRRMFPELRQTRFRNSAEFYTLFLLVWQMDRDRFLLADRKRNRIAFELLKKLSTGVDLLREQLRKAQPGKPAQRLFQEYLLTVQGDTDSAANRERRATIIRNLLWSLYDRKDERRAFTAEQRRIIWNSEDKRLCPRCHKPLHWKDFTVDHIVAHARGGRTTLRNAQPMHRRCNASKGAR